MWFLLRRRGRPLGDDNGIARIGDAGFESMAQGLPTRVVRRPPGAVTWCIALLIALATGTGPGSAPAQDAHSDDAILFLGRDFTGPSKVWSLTPDQAFLAIPYTGDEFRPVSASIKLGADVGVVLFQQPFFSSTDETCDYRLGRADDPGSWWLSDKVVVLPEAAAAGPIEANLRPQEIASLILFRRALGPPPGILLLERRRYVNWDCQAPTKARGYKRLFVPVAAAPHRQGCFNLEAALSYGESGTAALDFSAASELLLLEPGDLGDQYAGIDHRFTADLYRAKDCQGEPARFPHPQAGARRFDLKAFDLDRKAGSLSLRYDQGPYDPMLVSAPENPPAPAQDAVGPPVGSDETPAEASQEPGPETARVEAVQTEEVQAETIQAETIQAETIQGEDERIEEVTAEDVQVEVREEAAAETLEEAAAEDAAAEPAPDLAEKPAAAPEPEAVAEAVTQTAASGPPLALTPAAEAQAPTAPEPAAPAAPDTPAADPAGSSEEPGAAASPDDPSSAANTGSMAASPAGEAPQDEAAPEQTAPDETAPEDTTGFLVLPEGSPETGDGAKTFKFPLLQGYRLSTCLYNQKDCGEPAASEWCRARGFAGGASAFEIDENIGSLFPTLALGDLQLCANFVCDGFKEIVCQP